MCHQAIFRQTLKDKMLATAYYGNGEFMHLGCGKNKDHTRRRFLKSFEQSIESRTCKHMRFINNKDFIAPFHGRIANIFTQSTRIIHAIIGRAVNFDDIHMISLGNHLAIGALITWLCRGSIFTI